MLQMLSPLIKTVEKVKEKWLSLKVTTKINKLKKIPDKRDISATEGGRVPLQCHLKLTEEQQSLERLKGIHQPARLTCGSEQGCSITKKMK